ncbi:hypothetical protein Acr_13g0012130 [Actinidia rufa]|uniref:Uncharacterized protein n=1 Tax=Actinidia rufa TaxID=165716 RepID=A0A7J0FMK5_9ERIC|nr:hypothetical protein Acr_13g0012130 [Actinidia rufa]
MESAKETAAKIAASAKAGMEKTKATVEEKFFPSLCGRIAIPEMQVAIKTRWELPKLMMSLQSPWMQRLNQRPALTTRDPLEKEMAERRKEERIREAERKKQQELEQSTAARRAETVTGVTPTYSTTGTTERNLHYLDTGQGSPLGRWSRRGVVPPDRNCHGHRPAIHGSQHQCGSWDQQRLWHGW